MGFDNECILNIQSLAGEYFCPVCRLLVYPNEALQSQCTHLYCKPCLTYIVGTTRACPYDGYLVTEADSKPLIESNKALAETIGKIAVHCLYHRSGCQWQGPLSECTSHCTGCAFGNSPVVCNRCGIQIVHRQVQEHAQNCSGVQPQALQAAGVQDAAAGATTTTTTTTTAASANAEQTQIANQSGASTSQAQTSLTLAGPPTGQDPNQQANANSQVQAVASTAVPTPEQWYQQQYQQHYHQHPGYDPYQQPYQNYQPYQQQAIQQYQQHPQHVQVQHQPQVYSQAQPHTQFQPQVQSQPQPLPPPPPPPQTQQPQMQPPSQTHQPQIQPHTQPQPLQLVHAPVTMQASVNPQHQLHSTLQPHAQIHSQAQSQPHGHPHPQPQPQPYAQAQSLPQPHPVQPHLQQHMQIPQYQQPQSQMQHPQPQIQPQHSLPQLQPQRHLQAQPQAHVQAQAQPQLQPQPHPRPQLPPPPPPPLNQPPNINAQSQTQYPPPNAVTGLQSYPHPQAHQQMQLGSQQPPHMHPQGGPIPQPPHQMGPPQSHAPVPKQQQPVLLSSQGQVPSIPPAQQHLVHPHAQQPGHPGLQRPVLQPMQQPVSQQYFQHPQPFPGQTLGPVQNQLHPHGHFIQQQPMQSQLRPQGLHHMEQQNSQDNMSSQQNIAHSHGLQTHQPQNYAARPMMPSHGAQSQPFPQSPVGFAGTSQVRPMQLGANQPPANQNYPPRSNHQMQMSSEQKIGQSGLTLKPRVLDRQGDHIPEQSVADSKDGSSFQETALKEPNGLVSTSGLGADSVQVRNIKSETDVQSKDVVQKPMDGDKDSNSQVDMHGKDMDSELHAGGNASAEPAVNQMVKKECNESGLGNSPGAKSVKIVAAGPEDATDLLPRAEHSAEDGNSLQQVESSKKRSELEKDVIDTAMLVTDGADKGSQAIPLASTHIPDSSAESQTPLTGGERLQHGSQERNLSQSQLTTQGPGVDEFRSFPSHDQVLGKGVMPPGHPFPPTDHGRHQHMPMYYGPSAHQQSPAGAAMLQSALPHAQVPGQPPNMLRPQGPGHLPQPGQPLNPPDHLQPPVLRQPQGSFHPEIASGGIPGPSSSSLGRGPSHFGPERNFGLQSFGPQGHYNQGHVPPSHAGLPRMAQGEPPHGGLMGIAPPHGPEGQIGQQRPSNRMESEVFLDQRSRHLDGRQSDSHLLGSSEGAPFGQPHGIEANVMRMNGPPGTHSSSFRDERFNHRTEEGLNHFPMEPAWHVDRGELKEDLKQYPRNPHLDTEPGPKFGSYFSSSRPNDRGPHGLNYDAGLNLDPGVDNAPRLLPPYHPSGSNDTGYRSRPVGPDGNIGRADSTRTHPDFLGPFPGFGRHHMDRAAPRSPGREYHGFSPRDLRGFSGLDDSNGRESRTFGEGSRSFNLRRGELDGPRNVQSGDSMGQDILPSRLRRGDFLGPQNLRGDLHFGEAEGFGSFHGHARMGDLSGPGNFLHRLPHGEPFGGDRSGHPRLGEPGFRSSYSLTGGMDPFDNSRKRKLASMGWCRICKVDCETVEGLDLHSQTRQHQKMAMDMVLSIKKQNAKKQKTSNVHSSLEEPSKSRGSNYDVRGNKS
ncbi:hypothetical protein HYC85_007107 [Camellia sinensis]|uniref:RING-type domain-containing protein n=1 Tax=Camellia sinensis TaxID=4442 RepID=A0A7J7HPY4_CAMSI|nr:hypothetical protein HYC85_007107 [Camellia sinensis]